MGAVDSVRRPSDPKQIEKSVADQGGRVSGETAKHGVFYNLGMNKILTLCCLIALSQASAAREGGFSPAVRDAVDADGAVRRGVLSGTAGALSVDACAAASDSLKNKPVTVEGRVTSVCTEKGCWFVMTGDESDAMVRVRFKDYKYFMPKDVPGRRARVQGTLEVKKLSRRAAQHYENDRAAATGEKPRKIKSGRVELTLMADAVEVAPKAAAPAE